MSPPPLNPPPFVAVIMAGGRGQRFWPLSTEDRPKQFLDLEGSGRTLLQATFDRLTPLTGGAAGVFVIAGKRYATLIREQLPDMPKENLLLEPTGRDTAPAVALAALSVQARFGPTLMGLFSSDHRIGNPGAFQTSVRRAIDITLETRGLTTIGIRPDRPATGYGYIQQGTAFGEGFKVAQFVEKPGLERAQAYVASGEYGWNAGIFVWHTDTVLGELRRHAPALMEPLERAFIGGTVTEVFPTLKKISIDYAVMEHTDKAYVVHADCDWDDLGDWVVLERLLAKQGGNTVVGNHIGLECGGNIIHAAGEGDTIVTLGVEDLIIAKRGDTVLVVHKNRVQDIKKLLEDERVKGLVVD